MTDNLRTRCDIGPASIHIRAEDVGKIRSELPDRDLSVYVDLEKWPRGQLRTGLIYPSAESWPTGDRRVICEVGIRDGRLAEASLAVRAGAAGPGG